MGLEFLARLRRSSFVAGCVASLLAMSAGAVLPAGGLFAGVLASLLNLELVRLVVTGLLSPDRGTAPAVKRAAAGLVGTPLLLGAGWLLLRVLPPAWLMAGFLLPFAVLLLKACSTLLLGSRAWATLTRSRWRGAFVVGALVVLAWLGAGAWARAHAAPHVEDAPLAAPVNVPGAARANPETRKDIGFPTLVSLLEASAPHARWVEWVVQYEAVLFAIFIAALLAFLAWLAGRKPQRIPTPLQNLVEWIVEYIHDFVVGILGPKYGPRYVPFLGTLFLYIFAMNLFGLIPLMHSPTSSLNVTVALALTVFVYVQYTGFRELGVVGWFDHMLGNPRDVTGWVLAPLMLPIHLLGELAKPISLSCRLFGNIFGEDMLLVAFATLGISILSGLHLPFGLPIHALFFPLALLGSALQAMVFTVLTTIYLLLMLPHEHHESGHEAEATHAH
ncbi:MAG TPA: F0F1 ATP synthase subunit A [Candidatus Acidoferrales bacterium]|nr:F0F1 ATP synthase subunit A [Candidatus Acidoferrales bacterium]